MGVGNVLVYIVAIVFTIFLVILLKKNSRRFCVLLITPEDIRNEIPFMNP